MHISLDSALGRQRRLNQIGETISSIATPTAAYSLRSLTGGDPKVVRVRRSTGGEEDFTASGVSSGALVDFVGSSNDGFVATWYDQLGVNHATQGDSDFQPKIVGVVTPGQPHRLLGGIKFDGTDDRLDLTSALGITSTGAVFVVATSGGGSDKLILDNRDSGSDGFRVFQISNELEFRWKTADVDTGTSLGTARFLGFVNHDGSNASAAVNGATATTVSDSSTFTVDATARIGARSFSSADSFWNGKIDELILYNSDQNANRSALQTNINDHYSIF